MKADDFPNRCALLEAIANCIRTDAHIECYCDYSDAEYEGYYISIKARGYGKGKPKNLLSLYLEQPLVCVYIPRIITLDEFNTRYGFSAIEIRADNTSSSVGKPYHTVTLSTQLFEPLTTGKNPSSIRRFLIRSTRDALALRGLSEAGLEKLRQTAALVKLPSLSPQNNTVPKGIIAPNNDTHPDFTQAMRDLYRRTFQVLKYNAHNFLKMLDAQYGYDTALQLVLAAKPPSGFAYLWKKGRLDLSVEALVLQPKWHPLFPDEVLLAAHSLLKEYEYQSPSNLWKPGQRTLPPPSPPPASDLNEGPAGRVKSTIYRIIRDTEKARSVKAMHEYHCQICGHRILLPDGSFYAEAHHIKPLGEDGPDIIGNIICVCPNHHAELDYRAVPLDLAKLRIVPGHSLDPNFVNFHNHANANRHCPQG